MDSHSRSRGRYGDNTPENHWVVRGAIGPPVTTGRTLYSWWYGPDHGWGTTFGTLDWSVATWPTAAAARSAIRNGYRGPHRSRLTVQRVDVARQQLAEQRGKVTK